MDVAMWFQEQTLTIGLKYNSGVTDLSCQMRVMVTQHFGAGTQLLQTGVV